MTYVPISLEGQEPCFFGSFYGINLDVGGWFVVVEANDQHEPTKIAVDPTKIRSVLSVFGEYQRRRTKKRHWSSADLHPVVKTIIEKLITVATTPNTMIDLTNITADQLAELKTKIADREATLKKVTETQHSFEVAAKKAGYETLDAALSALGYVKAGAKKTAAKKSSSGRKPRVKVTDEIRAKVVASIQAGGKTSEEIAEENGLSTGTVSSIKKAAKVAGLIK